MVPAAVPFREDNYSAAALADEFPAPAVDETKGLIAEAALRVYVTNGRSPLQRRDAQCLTDNQVKLNPVSHLPSSVSAKGYRGPMMKRNESIAARTFADSSADIQESDVAKQISACLVVDFAHYKGTPKVVARLAGASPQAAKNWLAGQHPPSLVSFLRLLPHSPSLRKLVAMESDLSPEFTRELNALIQRHLRG
jgi:hypothetical protein